MNAFLRRIAAIDTRDLYFWLGLALLGTGLAGRFSWGIGAATIGSLLVLVAIFGVASSRGDASDAADAITRESRRSSRADLPPPLPEVDD